MLWYIQHPEQRLAMGKAAREHAVKHFAETRILDILSDIYLTCHTSPVGATA
jgi:hypothetical protein